MTRILETKNLTKAYGSLKALDQVSISINQGDIYGLIGRNGAGKTSLLKIICGMTRQSAGDYFIFGQASAKLSLANGRIASLIENPGIYPSLNARDHIELRAKALGIKDRNIATKSLNQVGLGQVGKKPVKSFSLGMKQRLGIAMALVGSPDLVLLDEPMNGLDPQGIVEIRQLVQELNATEHVTFMISSHILGELQKLANCFGILEEGRLLGEIDGESLAEKNRDRIELVTNEASRALPVLDSLGLKQYKVVDPRKIYIFEGLNRTGDIALALAKANLPIESINFHSRSLEEYYLSLNREFMATNADQAGEEEHEHA